MGNAPDLFSQPIARLEAGKRWLLVDLGRSLAENHELRQLELFRLSTIDVDAGDTLDDFAGALSRLEELEEKRTELKEALKGAFLEATGLDVELWLVECLPYRIGLCDKRSGRHLATIEPQDPIEMSLHTPIAELQSQSALRNGK